MNEANLPTTVVGPGDPNVFGANDVIGNLVVLDGASVFIDGATIQGNLTFSGRNEIMAEPYVFNTTVLGDVMLVNEPGPDSGFRRVQFADVDIARSLIVDGTVSLFFVAGRIGGQTTASRASYATLSDLTAMGPILAESGAVASVSTSTIHGKVVARTEAVASLGEVVLNGDLDADGARQVGVGGNDGPSAVHGSVNIRNSQSSTPGSRAHVSLAGATVDGDVALTSNVLGSLVVAGAIQSGTFRRTTIGGNLTLSGNQISIAVPNKDIYSVNSTDVAGRFSCDSQVHRIVCESSAGQSTGCGDITATCPTGGGF